MNKITHVVVLMLLTSLGSFNTAAAEGEKADKPNVLFICVDDISWFDAGCYGNADIKTPNIDALAAEGLKFNQAFTAMCGPSSSSILGFSRAATDPSPISAQLNRVPAGNPQPGQRAARAGAVTFHKAEQGRRTLEHR